jgi:hypothetical protein
VWVACADTEVVLIAHSCSNLKIADLRARGIVSGAAA